MRALAIVAVLGTTGCNLILGVDDVTFGEGDDVPDASIDADPNAPDAAPDASQGGATRRGLIAILDLELTDPSAAAIGGISGGVISIDFRDISGGDGQRVFGTSPLGGCIVTRYDAVRPEPPRVDVGPVTIAGSGLNKTVGPCSYSPAYQRYVCVSHSGSAVGMTASYGGVGGQVNYRVTGQQLTGADLEGSHLHVTGFANTAFNSASGVPYPVVADSIDADADSNPDTMTVINGAVVGGAETAPSATYSVMNGFSLVPHSNRAVDTDFLGLGMSSVTVTKAMDSDWGSILTTLAPQGDGFTLDMTSAEPHEFPTVAGSVTFSCAGAGGNCGSDGSSPVEATIVNGRTTDGSISGLPGYSMPAPIGAYHTFSCAFILANSATIPMDAVTALLADNPTRIEVMVARVSVEVLTEGDNSANVVIGHGRLGHADL